ncbi:MAG TPA: hypothetical protein VFC19_20015 [Candidatus Limnocylindrales bacterium]|nr:hypothetical protein [Candidatus Limnocylindrales bacterium]
MSAGQATTGLVRLLRLTEVVLNQVSHWSEARWGPLGETLHDVIQRMAGPDHALPRLGSVALPDQLRVIVADVLREGDSTRIDAALDDLAGFRGTLKASQ